MHFNHLSSSQVNSDKLSLDMGLLLTKKIVLTKTKLKEICPTLICQWDGQTLCNQIAGKGRFSVRNSLTNDLLFECQVKKWKNGIPLGQIKVKKVNFFKNDDFIDYKVKQIHSYEGNSENLKKHGHGIYVLQEFYSSGKMNKSTITGEWSYDILVRGVMQNKKGKKDLNFCKNQQGHKQTNRITIESDQQQNFDNNVKEVILSKKGPFQDKITAVYGPKQNYLDPRNIK